MQKIIEILVAVAAVFLIVTYLIPLLPSPLGTVALIVLVIAVIVWLLKWGGLA